MSFDKNAGDLKKTHTTESALAHMQQNIRDALSFLEHMSLDEFCTDRKTFLATTRCLEIISEASRRLPEDLRARHPHINWKDVKGAGNVYRHDYEEIEEEKIYSTVKTFLPPLLLVVDAELANIPEDL